MAKIFITHKATCKLYCFKAVYNAKTHFGKRGKKIVQCIISPVLRNDRIFNYLIVHMYVYVSPYGYSFHLLSISADTKPFHIPIGYFGIYIAFPLLRFQALLGTERIFRWEQVQEEMMKNKKTPVKT